MTTGKKTTPAGERVYKALRWAGRKGLTREQISEQAAVKPGSVKVLISQLRGAGVPIVSPRKGAPDVPRGRMGCETYWLDERTGESER